MPGLPHGKPLLIEGDSGSGVLWTRTIGCSTWLSVSCGSSIWHLSGPAVLARVGFARAGGRGRNRRRDGSRLSGWGGHEMSGDRGERASGRLRKSTTQ